MGWKIININKTRFVYLAFIRYSIFLSLKDFFKNYFRNIKKKKKTKTKHILMLRIL